MAKIGRFNIGFFRLSARSEHLFISVTPGLEHGPGIQRDGITAPRMTDPHGVEYVCNANSIPPTRGLSPTTNPYVQRAGTWTLYDHIRAFIEAKGRDWQFIGVQS